MQYSNYTNTQTNMAQVKLKSLCFLITSAMILTVMADVEEDTSLSDSSPSLSHSSESPSPSPSHYPSDNDHITPSSNNNGNCSL
jgi:hypothetical protein